MGKNSNVVSLGQYFLSWSALWSGRSINLESGDLNSNPGSPVSQFFDSMKNYFLSLIFSLPLKYMPNKSLPGLLLRQATEWMQKHEWDSEMTVMCQAVWVTGSNCWVIWALLSGAHIPAEESRRYRQFARGLSEIVKTNTTHTKWVECDFMPADP